MSTNYKKAGNKPKLSVGNLNEDLLLGNEDLRIHEKTEDSVSENTAPRDKDNYQPMDPL